MADNLITTTAGQIAAIRIDTTAAETRNLVIQHNLLAGENRTILVEGPQPDAVTLRDNTGAEIERKSE